VIGYRPMASVENLPFGTADTPLRNTGHPCQQPNEERVAMDEYERIGDPSCGQGRRSPNE
jgi:hypothetical protein